MTDEQTLEHLMERNGLQVQMGLDMNGWHIRVRGEDPTGAVHEDEWMAPTVQSYTSAALRGVRMFCLLYGLPSA